MIPLTTRSSRLSFATFEVDVSTGELWKAGRRIKLQSQPFKVLIALLERPGEIVSREELQQRLWGSDTVVDFDHALGTAVNKIRDALGDIADNPRFIETLSRRGYRFIAPVGQVEVASPVPPVLGEAPILTGGVPMFLGTDLERSPTPASSYSAPAFSGPIVSAAMDAVGDTQPTGVLLAGDRAGNKLSAIEPAALLAPAPPSLWWRPARLRSAPWLGWVALVAVAVAIFLGFMVGRSAGKSGPPHITQVTHNDHVASIPIAMEDLHEGATDGIHLFVSTIDRGQAGLSSVDLNFGSVEPVETSEVLAPALADISPSGAKLLVRSHLSPESEQPLWIVPAVGGSAHRVGEVQAHDATWMPGGERILFAYGNDLYTTDANGTTPALYAHLAGRALWMRWKPRGRLLRFTLLDPLAHTTSLWQMTEANRRPVPILLRGDTRGDQKLEGCCGVWAQGGKSFVFQAIENGNMNLWELDGESTEGPRQLTDGPLQYQSPMAPPTGSRVYFVGADVRSELARLSPGGALAPVKGFLQQARRLEFSRDGRWVAWTDSRGDLWRARSNGSEVLQLTSDLNVFLACWSANGQQLALMAREPGKPWRIFTLPASGGEIHPLLGADRNRADPSWSQDGTRIAFGGVNDLMGKEGGPRAIEVLDLASGHVAPLPGSEGLFSPRWSPDGRYIAALTLNQKQVKLYDVTEKRWLTPAVLSGADPVWAADSRSLVVHASMDPSQPIVRIHVPDLRVEKIADLVQADARDPVDFVLVGLDADGSPMIRSRTYTGNIYSLDLEK